MKFLMVLGFLVTLTAYGQPAYKTIWPGAVKEQAQTQPSTFEFCSHQFTMPAEYSFRKEAGKKGIADAEGTFFVWEYPKTEKAAGILMESFAARTEEDSKSFKKEMITCFLMGTEVNALRMSFDTEDGTRMEWITGYGTVKGQPVLFHLAGKSTIKKNKDIPDGMRGIIGLNK